MKLPDETVSRPPPREGERRRVTREDYDAFCAGLPRTSHVVQWGGASVWKVAGKVFAVGAAQDDGGLAVSFKCTPGSFAMLKDAPGLRPAPYLASRGMTWLQRTGPETLDEAALHDYLRASHALVAAGLSKKKRAELGLLGEAAAAEVGA